MEASNCLLPARLSAFHAQRVCLIKPSALGDVVQALPVLNALRTRFPKAHIAWLVNRAYAPLLKPIPILDEVIEFDRDILRGAGLSGALAFLTFLRELGDRKFDLAIDLQGLFRSGLLSAATRARRRIGLQSAREGSFLFYTDLVDDVGGSSAAVERYWQIAEILGVGNVPKEFPLSLTDAEKQEAASRLTGLPRPYLALQPGARWETKRWPAASFAAAASNVLRERGGSAIVLGGPGEEPIAAEVAKALGAPFRNLAGTTSLRLLAAVLEACDAVLTNDSGPMHLAAAVGTPTVSLFTCTSPDRAGPYGQARGVVETSVPCRGSYLRTCDRMTCMKDLTPEKILPRLYDVLPPGRRNGCQAA
jgi:lipopolysaccharide heptosyltransferase II